MKTAKQALLAAGRIDKVGKGRISYANHEWLGEQYAAGVRFSDWEPKEKVSATGQNVLSNAKPTVSSEKVIADLSIRYRESDWKAVETETGKERSMRSACNRCRLSLVGCFCEHPLIVSTDGTKSVAVTVKPRK